MNGPFRETRIEKRILVCRALHSLRTRPIRPINHLARFSATAGNLREVG
jgi:hypothetical protein